MPYLEDFAGFSLALVHSRRYISYWNAFWLPPANEVWGKVMFSQVLCFHRYLSVHRGWGSAYWGWEGTVYRGRVGHTPHQKNWRYASYWNAFYHPQTKFEQGNIFRSVCQEFCPQGGVCLSAFGIPPPPPPAGTPKQASPQTRHPQDQALPPPRAGTPQKEAPLLGAGAPPQRRACWEIRSTSGRYASYWNAILFFYNFVWVTTERGLSACGRWL